MTDSIAKPGRRGRGRPQVEKHTGHTIWCTEAGWTWLLEQSTGKGHKSVGKWADALGRSPIMAISQSRRREYGQSTTFERDPDGGYAWSVAAVQERHGFRTTREFAEAFGVSPRTVESWRAGRPPSRLALEKLRHWARSQSLAEQGPSTPAQDPPPAKDSEWADFLQMNSQSTTTTQP